MIATASEDGSVGVWHFPRDGLTEHITEPLAYFEGHSKKLTHLKFNPTTNNCIATLAQDKELRLWDVVRGQESSMWEIAEGTPTGLEWNYNGSLLATCDKSKNLTIVDPRGDGKIAQVQCHDGPQQQKLTWIGDKQQILTFGFKKKNRDRELAVWDQRKLEESLYRVKVDNGMGALDPIYDMDNGIFYCPTKGQAKGLIYEYTGGATVIDKIGSFECENSIRGFSLLPKKFLDSNKTQLRQGVWLTKDKAGYTSFQMPKKKGAFIKDFYPPCEIGEAAQGFEEWKDGKTEDPVRKEVTQKDFTFEMHFVDEF